MGVTKIWYSTRCPECGGPCHDDDDDDGYIVCLHCVRTFKYDGPFKKEKELIMKALGVKIGKNKKEQ